MAWKIRKRVGNPLKKYLEKMSMRKLNIRQSNYVYQTWSFYSIGNEKSGVTNSTFLRNHKW